MIISPSIMCADLLHLGDALTALEQGGADSIHVDVMDGHFVPGFTFGADAVRQMASATRLPLDIHLMSDDAMSHIGQFSALGVASMLVHPEATPDVVRCLATIRAAGMAAGIAINPGTGVEAIDEILAYCDSVLVMTVCPGFIGQRQLPGCLRKAVKVKDRLDERGLRDTAVIVDGGVKPETIASIASAGIDAVVSGTGIFRPDMTIMAALALMRRNAEAAVAQGRS